MKTLLLDQGVWDLVLDSAGNIACGTAPYALAQDVASAVKLFLGELYFDTTKGIPYFADVLGYLPPGNLMIAYIEKAALTVPGVATAKATLTTYKDRTLSGVVQFTDNTGATATATF